MQYDLCIVGLKCYDHLRSEPKPRYLGGIEKQLVNLARLCAASGMRVAFITYDEGQDDVERLDGVEVIKSYRADAGLPGLRLVWPRTTGLLKTIGSINAPIIVQMGGGIDVGRLAFAVRGGSAKHVFLAASDGDCKPELPFLPRLRERLSYRWGLRKADVVIVQSNQQRDLLLEHFNVQSTVAQLPYVGPALDATVTVTPPERAIVLWVGRFTEVKRVEWLLDIAESFDAAEFHIVGAANTETNYAREMKRRASGIDNVVVHGKLSETDLQRLFQTARTLCCTSVIEGFPTTFIEACYFKLPIVTTFDPDGFVTRNNIGPCVENVATLREEIGRLVENDDLHALRSSASAQAFESHFSAAVCLPPLLEAMGLDQD